MRFSRSGIVLKPSATRGRLGVLNPGCARLRDNTLHLYPRMVAPGNVSLVGSFTGYERPDSTLELEFGGFALEPEAEYELRDQPGGYGCEDPRVTFVPGIDRYVMAYVAFGPRAPEVAVASRRTACGGDGWGCCSFKETTCPSPTRTRPSSQSRLRRRPA